MFEEKYYLKSPLRLGIVGGGKGSQIGYSHRNAAKRDGFFQLVAGALDIDPKRGREFAQDLQIDLDRCYADYKKLFEEESKRKDGIQVVTIATPNHTHYEITKLALEYGLHVICEKPLTFTSKQAQELTKLAQDKQLVLVVMYGYSGYTMVEQARAMVARGDIGEVRIIKMEFAHGYHASEVEKADSGTKWRTTPEIAGLSYVLGDIGTHAFQMGQYIGSCQLKRVFCHRQSFIKSRAPLEDNAHVLLEYTNGAVGTLWASAVNIGSAHGFRVRVIGSKGMVEWWDEHPNQLQVAVHDQPIQTYEHGQNYLVESAKFNRIGGGHPEGFFDSWSNLYRRFGAKMANISDSTDVKDYWFPSTKEGLEGVKLVEKCVQSANEEKWVNF